MLPFYLFAAILGAGLLLFGLFGADGDGGHHGHDGWLGNHGSGHGSGGAHHGDLDVGAAGDHSLGWTRLFSTRTLSYVLAGFGLTGTGLTLVGTPAVTTLLLAILMAVIGGSGVAFIFGWLAQNQGGFGEPSRMYVGGIGQTEVRIPAVGRGRIQLVHRGRAFTLAATSVDGEIDRNETVIVVDVVDGVAVVGRAPRELAP